jgi:hypothetical protein
MRTRLVTPAVVVLPIVLVTILTMCGAGASMAAPSFIVHHQLEAEVSQVDWATGVLLLKTDAGRLKLDVPADATGSLRKGDGVVVHVTLIRHPEPARVPRAAMPQRPVLVEQLLAEVAGIQRTVGVVALKTSAGRLNIDVPASALVGLRTGEQLPLELAVFREAGSPALPGMERRGNRAGLAALIFGLFGRPK